MSSRRYNFSHLSDADLNKLAEWYPDAVETVRKPNYRVLSMLATCKARLPEGVNLVDDIAEQNKQAAESDIEEKPAFLQKGIK